MDNGNMKMLASQLEDVAGRLTEIGDTENSEKFIGLGHSIESLIDHMTIAMFPYHFGDRSEQFGGKDKRTWELMRAFGSLEHALCFVMDEENAHETALKVMEDLPQILSVLKTDIRAAYEGDPAATSEDEVILTYPAFKAISIFRMAHKLYEMRVGILPRMMTEYAHKITGIDIHPGATIGRYFFIDHGTGVVIGETTTIGEHVKLYQHVTLGAKSFAVGEDGILVKGIKRHPDIGNNVVIYAGATILGGDTVIGDNAVIGGNVWLTHSVPDGAIITNKE